jgi:hypothetical protein
MKRDKNRNKKSNDLIPKFAAEKPTKDVYLNKNLTKLDAWKQTGNEANIFLSLRFIQYDFQCFSEWNKTEMKIFWHFQDDISNWTWQQIYNQSRKSEKTGFGYTVIKKNKYPDSEFLKQLSEDITLFEMRIDLTKRIHGFRHESFFYACWLDKNHKICD